MINTRDDFVERQHGIIMGSYSFSINRISKTCENMPGSTPTGLDPTGQEP